MNSDPNHDYSHSHSTINSHDKEASLRDTKPPGYWDDEPETEVIHLTKSMKAHTSEPWIFDETNTGRSFSPGYGLMSETGSIGVFVERQKPKGNGFDDVDCNERAIANCERIIQCVNACAGVKEPEKMITIAKEAIRYIAGETSVTRLKNAIKQLTPKL